APETAPEYTNSLAPSPRLLRHPGGHRAVGCSPFQRRRAPPYPPVRRAHRTHTGQRLRPSTSLATPTSRSTLSTRWVAPGSRTGMAALLVSRLIHKTPQGRIRHQGVSVSFQPATLFTFDFFQPLPIQIQVSDAPLTSDAGLLPLRQFDERIGLTKQFAAVLDDPRHPDLIEHSFTEMVRMRIFGILAGYEDQHDHDTLRTDARFKLIAD